MIFEPVWLSSAEHLQTFERAYRESSYIRRLVGAWKLPEGFPYTQGWMGVPWRIPIVMFSTGLLRIEDRLLDFEAKPWSLPFNRLHHLRTDLRFTLTGRDITAVDAFEFASPVIRYYNLPFARIRTNKGGELADFLLCVGGMGPLMGKIRQRTEELTANLREAFPEAVQVQPSPPTLATLVNDLIRLSSGSSGWGTMAREPSRMNGCS